VKVVVVSDLHPDASTAGFPRFEDVAVALNYVVKQSIEVIKPDAFVFAGDLITNDPTLDLMIRCQVLAQESARKLGGAGMSSFWVAGNHDIFEDGLGTTALDVLACVSGATVIKRPCILPLLNVIATVTNPRPRPDLGLFFPFAPLSHNYTPIEAAHSAVLAFGAHGADPNRVKLVVSHLMLEGIGPGSETQDMPRGRDVFLPIDELREMFPKAIFVQGHYHRQQVYRGVHVVGSLVRLTRGEIDNTPSFLILEME